MYGCTDRDAQSMRTGTSQWVVGLWSSLSVLLMLTASLAVAQGKKPGPPPAPVSTVRVEEGALNQPVRVTGTVEALASTTLSSEVAGYLAELLVDEGDRVRKGQELARLRALPYRLAWEQAKATARIDRERLRELRTGTRQEDLAVADANLDRAKVAVSMAKKNYTRNRSLQQRQIISAEDFDQAHETWEASQAELKVREALQKRAQAGARVEEIAAAEARAAASQAQAALAKDRLERTSIRAPFDGVITAKHTEVGSWVAVGSGVFDLDTYHKVWVRVAIPEAYYNRVPLGSQMSITFDSIPTSTFVGVVTQKIPRASGKSRAFPIKVELDNPDGQLASGMLARVVLETPHDGKKSVMVPRDALVPRGPKQVLFRVQQKDGKPVAEMLSITAGRYFGEAVEVFGDLRAGDRVVIRGNERLRPGQPLVMDQFLSQ